MYDYLIVGAGLFGSIFAYEAKKRGKNCLVIDKRPHIGGNIYTKEVEGINVHEYGAHIFHTSNHEVWKYIQQFATFNRYTNSPIARYKDEIYNMPFNMNTFNKLWGVITRLPVRFTYDNNYFNDLYQGIPIGGYTQIIEKMLEGIDIRLNCNYFSNRKELETIANKIVFTGMIDQYYDYCFGELEYRSLRFETEVLEMENYQGNAVVNYNEYEIPYTRIIEHKHFEYGETRKTVITREYPATWKIGDEPYYPMNDEKNNYLYEKYKALADKENKVIFGGRLGMYKYYDMHHIISEALDMVGKEFNE